MTETIDYGAEINELLKTQCDCHMENTINYCRSKHKPGRTMFENSQSN